MSNSIKFALCLFLVASTAQAVITTTGDVSPTDPSVWTQKTYGYIGNTSDGTLTVDGGSDILSYEVAIGNESNSTGTMTVSGAGTSWDNSKGYFYVGYEGAGELDITNGGYVESSGRAYLGYLPNSTGRMNVSGAGSAWRNYSSYTVGYEGTGELSVTNGGSVDCSGVCSIASASKATISGVGSILRSRSFFFVNGELNVTDGGTVESDDYSCLGYKSNQTGMATVSGNNSIWNNDGGLSVGAEGVGVLNIVDGGTVKAKISTSVGYMKGSSGAIYFDNGTLITDSLFAGSNQLSGHGTINTNGLITDGVDLIFDDSHGLKQAITLSGPQQNITINLDQKSSSSLGVGYTGTGTLTFRDGVNIESNYGYLGYHSGSSGTATVSGVNSVWKSKKNLYVGYEGNGELNISDGGAASIEEDTFIGYKTGSTGTIHLNNGSLKTGTLFASLSQITGTGTIDTNGLVTDGTDLIFDVSRGLQQTFVMSDQNRDVTVNLDQSSTSSLGAGYAGTGTLTIKDGVAVESKFGYLGFHEGSIGTGTVSGAGSAWLNNNDFYVGYRGTGNLRIIDGGNLSTISVPSYANKRSYLGYEFGAIGTVSVSGNGSTWTGNELLHVGYNGTGNLNVNNGGVVSCFYGYLGSEPGSTGLATVSGIGSNWTNSSFLGVGIEGIGKMSITDGGTVKNSNAIIAESSGSIGAVTVSGDGSTWTNSSLTVGSAGTGKLSIIDKGIVNVEHTTAIASKIGSSGEIYFENGTLNTGSLVTKFDRLTGNGTINTNGLIADNMDLVFDVFHGSQRTFNLKGQNLDIVINYTQNSLGVLGAGYSSEGTLTIRDGVTVESSGGCLGYESQATGIATVTGAGSTWTTANNITIGDDGDGKLYITDGGTVKSPGAVMGWGFTEESSGTVTVSGANSMWINSGILYVGEYGNAELNITDGGLVSVGEILRIDEHKYGDRFVNMSSGGMLALFGDADSSLNAFLGLVEGADAIRWWDDSLGDWAFLTTATEGDDYTLEYLTSGDLAGYTLLTVGTAVPEPGSVALLVMALLTVGFGIHFKRYKAK